jgi:hypothetical protein
MNCANLLCKNWQQENPDSFKENWKNFGQCVSFFRSGVVQFCEFLAEIGWTESVGQCVSNLRPNITECSAPGE